LSYVLYHHNANIRAVHRFITQFGVGCPAIVIHKSVLSPGSKLRHSPSRINRLYVSTTTTHQRTAHLSESRCSYSWRWHCSLPRGWIFILRLAAAAVACSVHLIKCGQRSWRRSPYSSRTALTWY